MRKDDVGDIVTQVWRLLCIVNDNTEDAVSKCKDNQQKWRPMGSFQSSYESREITPSRYGYRMTLQNIPGMERSIVVTMTTTKANVGTGLELGPLSGTRLIRKKRKQYSDESDAQWQAGAHGVHTCALERLTTDGQRRENCGTGLPSLTATAAVR